MLLEQILLQSAQKIGEKCIENIKEPIENKENLPVLSNKQNKDYSCHKNSEIKNETKNDKSSQNHSVSIINAYGRNKRLGVMVICAVIGLIICLLTLTLYRDNLSGEVIGIISTISGIFGACLKDAYSFEFGSSRGSREKDERLSATLMEHLKI